MGTFDAPIERTKHFVDGEGQVTFTKSRDEVDNYVWDLTDRLDSGETVSSFTTDVSGVTLNSSSLSTPAITLVVTGTNGDIRITATTSASRVLEQVFQFVDVPRGGADNDYRYSV